jgi:hypothetical protein
VTPESTIAAPTSAASTSAADASPLGAGSGPVSGSASLPEWCPAWAEQLGDAYLSGTSCVFLLHGNVRDAVPVAAPATRNGIPDPASWGSLPEFLARELFGRWDVVLAYDVGRGLRPLAGPDPTRLRTMAQWLSERLGNAAGWPRDPDAAIAAIDAILERNLIDPPEQRKRIAVVLDYAQYLVPTGEGGSLRAGAGRLVRVLGWATNPLLRRVNAAVVLVADALSEVHPSLASNPAVSAIDVPLPDLAERERFALATASAAGVQDDRMDAVRRVAALSGGLSLESLRAVITLSAREGTPPDGPEFAARKKDLIERSCRGLVEFVQPRLSLDAVAGHAAAKERLESDARAIRRGHLDAAPMGYLICGPVGTGAWAFPARCSRTSAASTSVRPRGISSTPSTCSADSGRWS